MMANPGDITPRVADEGDLCRLWAAGALPVGALRMASGARLHVIYPGRRSGAGGPDFQGAILADEQGRVRAGDVELHLRSRDWITHGHRADPAYNGVVLHVVLEDDGSPCLRADGTPVPVLALAGWVTLPLAGAAAGVPPAQPCRVSPALLTQEVYAIVRAAGRARLEEKAAAVESQIVGLGAEQALFAGLLGALGYSRNRVPCARLAERLPIDRLSDLLAGKPRQRAEAIATAVLLGLAGLLQVGVDDGLTHLWAAYGDLWPLPPLRADDWVRAGVRPANQPALRLRGMAALLARHNGVGLLAAVQAPVRAGEAPALLAALEVSASAGERWPPIGAGRAVAMASNVIVPHALALARSRGDTALEEGAWRVAAALPAEDDSEPLRHMRGLLAGSGHRLRAAGALEQQGLLGLYRAHCAVRACWACPLSLGGDSAE